MPRFVVPDLPLARWLARHAGDPARSVALGLALGVVAGVVLWSASFVQAYHWNLATGLLFVMLWALPTRWWPWLFAATIASRVAMGVVIARRSGLELPFLGHWGDLPLFLLGNLLEPFLVATGVWLLRRWSVLPGRRVELEGVARVHVAAALSALAISAKDLAYVLHEGWVADVRFATLIEPVPLLGPQLLPLLGSFLIRNLLGHFIGILLFAPLLLWWTAPRQQPPDRAVTLRGLLLLGPATTVFLFLGLRFPGSEFAELMRLLLVAAVAAFTLWQGWRGAVLSILTFSAAFAVEELLGRPRMSPMVMQAYLGVTGAMALLFGAAVDAYRRQAADLERARGQEHRLRDELQDAALRNLKVEEASRHRLARELHDEFGQNLAALQTHLKLAAPHLEGAGKPGLAKLLLDLTRAMQRNIGRVLADLRPGGLEQLGLYGAIDRGPIRRLAEDAGLALEVRLEGDARLLAELDGTHATAVYRLAQEALTNVVRHADARHCHLRLRINRRGGALWVFLEVRDDGRGRVDAVRPGNGMTGMRDRVLALNGALHLRQCHPGLRLHLLVRQDD